MSTTRLSHEDRFPPPYRAPSAPEDLAGGPRQEDSGAASDPGQRRYQRAAEGWISTRIRKQTRDLLEHRS